MRKSDRNKIQDFIVQEWLRPLTFIVCIAAAVIAIYKLMELPPTSPQVGQVESEVLARQLEFILKMNSAFLGFLGIIGALLTWFFKNSLDDAKKVAREIARQELATHLQPLVKEEIEDLDRSLLAERVVREAVIDYHLTSDKDISLLEHSLLENRGFRVNKWHDLREERTPFSKVLVIDFVHSEILPNPYSTQNDDRNKISQGRENIFKHTVKRILSSRKGNPVLIIYIRPGEGRIASIDTLTTDFSEVEYYTSANTPVALMGAVVDAAYVADSIYRS